VLLEGTAHMAGALKCRSTKHKATAGTYLAGLRVAQASGADADNSGILANSRVGWAGGDDKNHTSLHTGATAWYLMAEMGVDPFRLGITCS
jgi:hypothetical protein